MMVVQLTFIQQLGPFLQYICQYVVPSLFLDFEWQVHDDLCGSDHIPTF